MGDTKQSTPISAQITALRLKPGGIAFCDRFTDIKRKPILSPPHKKQEQYQSQIDRHVVGPEDSDQSQDTDK